jgi:hypothetical protein
VPDIDILIIGHEGTEVSKVEKINSALAWVVSCVYPLAGSANLISMFFPHLTFITT